MEAAFRSRVTRLGRQLPQPLAHGAVEELAGTTGRRVPLAAARSDYL